MTDYIWNIDQVQTLPFFGGQYNVVSRVSWHMTAVSGIFKSDYYGVTSVPTDNLEDFIPYGQLTNDQIASWLESATDMDWLRGCLDAQIKQLQEQQPITQVRG